MVCSIICWDVIYIYIYTIFGSFGWWWVEFGVLIWTFWVVGVVAGGLLVVMTGKLCVVVG